MPIKIFTNEEIRFIQDHVKIDPIELALSAKKHPNLPIKEIAAQIASRQKAEKKLPQWYSNAKVVFPPKENLEQASSEITARFKSRGIKGESILDLTGGSGVDLFYMCEGFEDIHYVEVNASLAEITEFNFGLFEKKIHAHNTSAESFLTQTNKLFDVIYIDPSRRDSLKNRVFGIEEYQPNILELYDQLVEKGREVVVKISPMVDIKHTLRQLPDTHKVQVVAVDNEVKEILFYLKSDVENEPVIETWNLSNSKIEQFFGFIYSDESSSKSVIEPPMKYLYEPNSAIRKSGAFNLIGNQFGLSKLERNTHLYTSNEYDPEFHGRVFEVEELIKPNKKEVGKRFKDGKVNVISKNFPIGANLIKKKFNLHDGGKDFLIFCEVIEMGKIGLHCKAISKG